MRRSISYLIMHAIFVLLLTAQAGFWYRTHTIKPDMSIVPDVPGANTVKALSFGDEQFFFRFLGLQLQNAGDTYGRFTALYKYDYNKLYHWFSLLDKLDDTSNYIPSMATYYYAQSQNKSDLKYIVDYLVEHSETRIAQKWWWLTQAVYLTNHRLSDKDRTVEIANMLMDAKDAPLWVRQMPAFIHEQRGEMDAAMAIIQSILNNTDDIEPGEINFMRHFVEERLQRIEQLKEDFAKHEQKQNSEHTEE